MSTQEIPTPHLAQAKKKDADFVFYELTRSICPDCRKVIDGQVILRDNKVYMRKRCPECGPFEALVYADAAAYVSLSKYNKQGQSRSRVERRFAMDVPMIAASALTISSTHAWASLR